MPDGVYGVGAAIPIRVRFSAPVRVDTTGGRPRIQLETGDPDRWALYTSGSGTTLLTFTYIVRPGDVTKDLSLKPGLGIRLAGGRIVALENAARDVVLTLPARGWAGSLSDRAAIVIETKGDRYSGRDDFVLQG